MQGRFSCGISHGLIGYKWKEKKFLRSFKEIHFIKYYKHCTHRYDAWAVWYMEVTMESEGWSKSCAR